MKLSELCTLKVEIVADELDKNEVKNEKRDMDFSLFLEKRVDFFNDLATAKNIEIFKNIQPNINIKFKISKKIVQN